MLIAEAQRKRGKSNTHVSKKLIGDLKIANAILSCSFLDAYSGGYISFRLCIYIMHGTICEYRILTSIEQNIHRMRVCTTTRAADPIPKTK